MRDTIEIIEGASGQLYYHVTFTTRIPAIMDQGLVPGKRRNWNSPMGAKQGNTKLIYLFDDATAAARWAASMEWDFKKPISIIVLKDVPGMIMSDDHIQMQMRGGHAVTTDEAVPPECIVRVVELTLEMKRQLAQTQTVTLS